MGCEDHNRPALAQRPQAPKQRLGRRVVKTGERLIEQGQPGLVNERTLERDTLGRLFVRPNIQASGAQNENPLQLAENNNDVNFTRRFLGGATLRYAPVSWLDVEGNFSYDYSANTGEDFQDKGFRTTSSGFNGYIGSVQSEENNSQSYNTGINAFTLGARSVNPDAVVRVVWTNTWYNPQTERQAAEALLDGGADVIAQHQDTAGPQQAAQDRGLYGIGYNADMSSLAPEAVLTSAIWNWGPYYIDVVEQVMNGTWESNQFWGGWKDGVVDLAPIADFVPEEIRAAAEEEIARFKI